VALSPDGRRLYTADGTADHISVLDTGTLKPIDVVASQGRPWGVAVIP
jgi:YVTN family beta-propeller protein